MRRKDKASNSMRSQGGTKKKGTRIILSTILSWRSWTLTPLRKRMTHEREGLNWVAVKELKLSYYIGETLLFTIYIPIMVT